jgi:hypothetical protein
MMYANANGVSSRLRYPTGRRLEGRRGR